VILDEQYKKKFKIQIAILKCTLSNTNLMKRICLVFILILIKTTLFAQVNSFVIDSSKFNKQLTLTLDTIYHDDQTDRLKLPALKSNQPALDSLWKIIRKKDTLNLIKVEKILNTYGWQGPQDVGMNASLALFLVIQHAGLSTQEKYLPIIQNAVKNGKTLSSNLAILEDRIAMRQGKKQIYGSQGFSDKATGARYVYPVIDPNHLDERRKAMGMPPMADYLKSMNLIWDLEAYKKIMPQIEKAASEQK
jgi:hypothetical protein